MSSAAKKISDEELAAALAEAVDDDGVDQRLATATAAMTDEQRRQSEDNLRRSIEEAQRSLRRKRDGTGDI